MRTYNFYEAQLGGAKPKFLEVKESDLTEEQIKLMLGEFINQWGNLPGKVQGQFVNYIIRMVQEDLDYEIVPKR